LGLLFGLSAAACIAAACGGNTPEPVTPQPTATAPATGPASTGTVAPAGSGAPAAASNNKPVTATAFAKDLADVGLDPKALPPLNKLNKDQLKKVMATFSKSLGWECKDCHGTKNFEAPHPMKKVAEHMWNDYLRGLSHSAGPLYCDSCHQGKAKYLDRSDKKALAGWMDAELTKKMKRVDGKEHSCATCHGDPFDPDFLDKYKK
jgi:hypothetical protein